jgi:hypothetical protein
MEANTLLRIKNFDSLIDFLVDELDWPIDVDNLGERELTFEYSADEIGLKETEIAKVKSIKQLRPIIPSQPWAIFWLEFENKKLPITILRRILRQFVTKTRAKDPTRPTWKLEDLMFVSAHGDEETRATTFAHFKKLGGKEVLREFSWDVREDQLEHYAGYLGTLHWPDDENDLEAWRNQWRGAFTGSTREAISTSLQLAKAMAWIAKDIKSRVLEVYNLELEKGPLHKLFDSFREALIHSMDVPEFADMYAQTITYGLFSARSMDNDGHFEMEEVVKLIPNTNPFLKELFQECLDVGTDHGQIDLDELGVGRLVDLLDSLNKSDGTDVMQRILSEFGRQTGGGNEDPIIHFYEGFLKEYDNLQRIERGVYYTPDPVVSFIVRSVHEKLKTDFGLELGLADTTTWHEMVSSGRAEWPKDPKTGQVNKEWIDKIKGRAFVQILDPATGTGTFLKHTITVIHDETKQRHNTEDISLNWLDYWNDYVYEKLLPRLYAFELMMASYSVAHMKVGMHLKSLGYRFERNQRLNIYLTNTLEPHVENMQTHLFFNSIGAESLAANHVKEHRFFTVIIGNPPYSGISSNNSSWISSLINDYKYVDGEHFGERKHWLNDDYVKFLRFGEHSIEKSGVGILGFINNHSFIDNPTFRGMRWHLLNTFNSIFIADLHGNSQKKEICPDGSEDKNVFDIKQGVSINLFMKTKMKSKTDLANIYHNDFWGNRNYKYKRLLDYKLDDLVLKEVNYTHPFYFYAPKNEKGRSVYEKGFKVDELFSIHGVGFVTATDKFNISYLKDEHDLKIYDIINLDEHVWREKYSRKKDAQAWKYKWAKQDAIKNANKGITKVNYRPFDVRYTLFTGNSGGLYARPTYYVLQHFIDKENIGITLCKQFKTGNNYQHIFISDSIIESSYVSNRTSEITSAFPLYLYPETKGQQAIEKSAKRIPNLKPEIISQIVSDLGLVFTNEIETTKDAFAPIELLDYIYVVLHSPIYREKYKEFLKIDFPRVPYPKDQDTFWQLVQLGSELRRLHLLESAEINNFITEYPRTGNNEVTKSMTTKSPGWIASEVEATIGDVWINNDQYFSGVPLTAWEFHVGGYQPAQKWLKDRKGRELSFNDIMHYQKIIVALTETDRLMKEVDKVKKF